MKSRMLRWRAVSCSVMIATVHAFASRGQTPVRTGPGSGNSASALTTNDCSWHRTNSRSRTSVPRSGVPDLAFAQQRPAPTRSPSIRYVEEPDMPATSSSFVVRAPRGATCRPTRRQAVVRRRRLVAGGLLVFVLALFVLALFIGAGHVLANRGGDPASTPAVRPATPLRRPAGRHAVVARRPVPRAVLAWRVPRPPARRQRRLAPRGRAAAAAPVGRRPWAQ